MWLVSQFPFTVLLLFAIPHVVGTFVEAEKNPCREDFRQMIYSSDVIAFCYFAYAVTLCTPIGVVLKPAQSLSISVLNMLYAVLIATAFAFSSLHADSTIFGKCNADIVPMPEYDAAINGTLCIRTFTNSEPFIDSFAQQIPAFGHSSSAFQKQLEDTCGKGASEVMATHHVISEAYGGVSTSTFLNEWATSMHLIQVYTGAQWHADDPCPRALNQSVCSLVALAPCTDDCKPIIPCKSLCRSIPSACTSIDFENLATDKLAHAALVGFVSPGVGNLIVDTFKNHW